MKNLRQRIKKLEAAGTSAPSVTVQVAALLPGQENN
jgi:hypothetical protein